MASSALQTRYEETQEQLASMRARMKSLREQADETAQEVTETVAELGGAYGVEKYIAGGGTFQIAGQGTRRTLAVLFYLGGTYVGDGEAATMMKAVGRGIACAEAARIGAGRV